MGNFYSRFYALLRRLPLNDEEMKERLVLKYTAGRTTSLRQMSPAEYRAMCDALEGQTTDARREELRRRRSVALRLMQRLGIDTTDWVRIDAFCRDQRIAGKPFGALDAGQLDALAVKLRGIERHGGLKPHPEPEPRPATKEQILYMPLDGGPIC